MEKFPSEPNWHHNSHCRSLSRLGLPPTRGSEADSFATTTTVLFSWLTPLSRRFICSKPERARISHPAFVRCDLAHCDVASFRGIHHSRVCFLTLHVGTKRL